MNIKRFTNALFAAAAALALSPSASLALDPDIFIGPTNGQSGTSQPGGSWINWYFNGGISPTWTFDAGNPPPTGNPAGAIHHTANWSGVGSGDTYDVALPGTDFWGAPFFDGGKYKMLEMDWRYDTNTSTVPTNFAYVDISIDKHSVETMPIIAQFSGSSQNTNFGSVIFDGAWHHVSIPIPIDIPGVSSAWGVGFKDFKPNGVAGIQAFWLANLTLIARNAPPPPPTMTIQSAVPGLKQFADASPNYNRQTLRTDTTSPGSKNIDWVGHPGATYTWEIKEFPGAGFGGYNAALTLTPDPPESITYSDPDWSATNAIWIQIVLNGNGTISSGIYFKTNQPSANGQFNPGGTGRLTGGNTLNCPTAVGTWTLAFPSDTSITLTAPNGSSTNVSLPADVAASYTNISFSFYTGMASDANKGQATTLTRFAVSGVANSFDENLTDGALNTSFLQLMSQGYGANVNPPNQVFVTSADAYWLHWTLPDNGFGLVQKVSLTDQFWLDYAPGNILLNGSSRWVKVPTASLPSPTSSFFAVLFRPFTQLQMLFPGESPAPNTLTGKTGTPTDVSLNAGGVMDITVRAVDPTFNLVSSGDTIHLTTTDGNAIVPVNVAMVNGIAMFTNANTMTFGTVGTQSVTATNISREMPAVTNSVNVIP